MHYAVIAMTVLDLCVVVTGEAGALCSHGARSTAQPAPAVTPRPLTGPPGAAAHLLPTCCPPELILSAIYPVAEHAPHAVHAAEDALR